MGAGLAAAEVDARSDFGDPRIHADLALQLILQFLHFQMDGFHICLQERENSIFACIISFLGCRCYASFSATFFSAISFFSNLTPHIRVLDVQLSPGIGIQQSPDRGLTIVIRQRSMPKMAGAAHLAPASDSSSMMAADRS